MYSPKIDEDLIPKIYHAAKARGMPMTKFVNDILQRGLETIEKGGEDRDGREGSARDQTGR